MSDVVQFPTRLSGRDLNQIYRFGAVGGLEVLLMHPPGDEPAPLEITLRAGGAVVEIASINDVDGDMSRALWGAHQFADACSAALWRSRAAAYCATPSSVRRRPTTERPHDPPVPPQRHDRFRGRQ